MYVLFQEKSSARVGLAFLATSRPGAQSVLRPRPPRVKPAVHVGSPEVASVPGPGLTLTGPFSGQVVIVTSLPGGVRRPWKLLASER